MPDLVPDKILLPQVAVVDDEPSVLQALRRLLRSAGFQVAIYASADEFLRSPTPEKHACVVLDVQMPGLNGLDLQKVIVSMKAPIPIIFITAHHEEDVRARAMAMGAVGFLEKPFDDQVLIDLIEKIVRPP